MDGQLCLRLRVGRLGTWLLVWMTEEGVHRSRSGLVEEEGGSSRSGVVGRQPVEVDRGGVGELASLVGRTLPGLEPVAEVQGQEDLGG